MFDSSIGPYAAGLSSIAQSIQEQRRQRQMQMAENARLRLMGMQQQSQQQDQSSINGMNSWQQFLPQGGTAGMGGAYSTTQAAAPAGGLAQSLGVASVPGGVGNAAAAGGTSAATGAGGAAAGGSAAAGGGGAAAGGGGASAGMGAAFSNPYMLIPALVAAGKMYESKEPDSPISRASLSLAGPSLAQMKEDPKLGLTTLAGVPFINGLIRSDKAADKKPEWMFWT